MLAMSSLVFSQQSVLCNTADFIKKPIFCMLCIEEYDSPGEKEGEGKGNGLPQQREECTGGALGVASQKEAAPSSHQWHAFSHHPPSQEDARNFISPLPPSSDILATE